MNLQDISTHWIAPHETLGLGAPIASEAQYEQALALVEALFDDMAADPAHPLDGLVDLLADRIREYEDAFTPGPTPACRPRCWPA